VGCRSSPLEARGSPTLEVEGRVGSSPDKSGDGSEPSNGPGAASVMEWCKRLNQCLNPLKRSNRLQLDGCGPGSSYWEHRSFGWSLLASSGVGAVGKSCGVPTVKVAGEKLGTSSIDRSSVNVGTALGWPTPPGSQPGGWGDTPSVCDPGVGRSSRSSQRSGKPTTWRRRAAWKQHRR
jgi:hypothetical protein